MQAPPKKCDQGHNFCCCPSCNDNQRCATLLTGFSLLGGISSTAEVGDFLNASLSTIPSSRRTLRRPTRISRGLFSSGNLCSNPKHRFLTLVATTVQAFGSGGQKNTNCTQDLKINSGTIGHLTGTPVEFVKSPVHQTTF